MEALPISPVYLYELLTLSGLSRVHDEALQLGRAGQVAPGHERSDQARGAPSLPTADTVILQQDMKQVALACISIRATGWRTAVSDTTPPYIRASELAAATA